MRPIRTHLGAKEKTQGRHYTPIPVLDLSQVLDALTATSSKTRKIDPQLRKLG
jgi:hypothetical protein